VEAHPGAGEIEAEVAAMAAERLGSSLRDETEADWIPVVTDWGSDGPEGWIDLEGGLRLRLTVELTEK
jgi:hypothetical protein